MSVQYIVDLCNTLDKDMWVDMPVGTDSTYLTNFATYVRDNLNPGLKVYVEYGGEVWNNAYTDQYAYVVLCDVEQSELSPSDREPDCGLLEYMASSLRRSDRSNGAGRGQSVFLDRGP